MINTEYQKGTAFLSLPFIVLFFPLDKEEGFELLFLPVLRLRSSRSRLSCFFGLVESIMLLLLLSLSSDCSEDFVSDEDAELCGGALSSSDPFLIFRSPPDGCFFRAIFNQQLGCSLRDAERQFSRPFQFLTRHTTGNYTTGNYTTRHMTGN